jgi:hypothetical protein
MKRAVSVLAAAIVSAALLPAAASAANIPIGVTKTPVVGPTCPSTVPLKDCTILLAQRTAYETLSDGIANPDMVKQSGVISSFTLGLAGTSLITPSIIASRDALYGGPPEAQLTALFPTGTAAKPAYRVVAQSEVVKLKSELGQVAEFPLTNPLPVVRGEVIALTIPTWAPVLAIEQTPTQFSYSQSRAKSMVTIKVATKTGSKNERVSSCSTSSSVNLAQIVVGELSNYSCNYPGARIEYSALEITTPTGFTGETRTRAAKR